jgi:hypothetical protein
MTMSLRIFLLTLVAIAVTAHCQEATAALAAK